MDQAWDQSKFYLLLPVIILQEKSHFPNDKYGKFTTLAFQRSNNSIHELQLSLQVLVSNQDDTCFLSPFPKDQTGLKDLQDKSSAEQINVIQNS